LVYEAARHRLGRRGFGSRRQHRCFCDHRRRPPSRSPHRDRRDRNRVDRDHRRWLETSSIASWEAW